MLVQLETADPRTDPQDTFDVEMQEVQTETVSGNHEYVWVTEVSSLDDVYEASQQGRVVVKQPLTSDFNGADVVVIEYDGYLE